MLRLVLPFAVLALSACTAPQPCPSPLHECDGQCVDVASDRRHCGACDSGCASGEVCFGGACTAAVRAPCPQRTGGAFVTVGHCGGAVKVWVRADAFIDEASRLLVDPDPGSVPSFAVLAGSDCDAQWSWHVDDATASIVEEASLDPASACTRCPGEVQPATPGGAPTARRWCPTGARILAVDDKRPAP